MKYNAMRIFKTELEAVQFAIEVNSDNWGWMKDCKTGEITGWYVDYNEKEEG